MTESDDEKYIVFNRKAFNEFLGYSVTEPEGFGGLAIEDAVVIRRQDKFASPCLLTYAAMISMVAEHHPDTHTRRELQTIADYFHRQGLLAGEEGWKLPTI